MLSKKQQLYKNKQPKISQVERDYLNWLQQQDLFCLMCLSKNNIELHHVKLKSTDKKNHKRLIPLCREHHKGNILSPHGTPTKWRLHISMELQNKLADELYNNFAWSL